MVDQAKEHSIQEKEKRRAFEKKLRRQEQVRLSFYTQPAAEGTVAELTWYYSVQQQQPSPPPGSSTMVRETEEQVCYNYERTCKTSTSYTRHGWTGPPPLNQHVRCYGRSTSPSGTPSEPSSGSEVPPPAPGHDNNPGPFFQPRATRARTSNA
jgi:hypothetical protein